MLSQAKTPKKRGGDTPGKKPPKTPPNTRKNGRNSRSCDIAGNSTSSSTRSGSPTDPPSSSKKLKIFHYFGGAAATTPPPPPRSPVIALEEEEEPAAPPTASAEGRCERAGGAAAAAVVAPPLREKSPPQASQPPGTTTASPAPAPTWGKIIDPLKQRKWEILRRLQEGSVGGGYGKIDPTAWARRSYSLSYASVFQDGRTPGMGSTGGGWGWSSQSHVFGGTRACLMPGLAGNSDADIASPHELHGGLANREMDTGNDSGTDADDRVGRGGGGTGGGKTKGYGVGDGVDVEGGGSRQQVAARKQDPGLQCRNFKAMINWLSSSRTSAHPPTPTAAAEMCPSEEQPSSAAAAAAAEMEVTAPTKSLLEVVLERRDGGPAAAFMTLMSLDPEDPGDGDAESVLDAEGPDPLALALRLYHAGSTWRRVPRRPAPRRRGQGTRSRLNSDDAESAAATAEKDDLERCRRSSAEFDAASVLLRSGVAVSLLSAAGGSSGLGRPGGGGGGWGTSGVVDEEPDVLVAFAPREALTADEARTLTTALGVSPTAAGGNRGGSIGSSAGGGVSVSSGGRVSKGGLGRRGSNGRGGGRGDSVNGNGRRVVESKEEVCRALEEWITRPADAARRNARVVRTARQAAGLIAAAGTANRKGAGGGGSARGRGDVVVLRLADDAREAIHRIHVAFFACARHGPHDAPAILREDLARVTFGGACGYSSGGGGGGGQGVGGDANGGGTGSRCSPPVRRDAFVGLGGSEGEGGEGEAGRGSNRQGCSTSAPFPLEGPTAEMAPQQQQQQLDDATAVVVGSNARGGDGGGLEVIGAQRGLVSATRFGVEEGGGGEREVRSPPPQILSSVETFAEYFRLVTLADGMELAAGAGDSG